MNRFVERRLTGLVGRNAVPRRDHVVVVGLGQVGMRLCLLLRACKIPLVAVESDEDGERVGIAKELGLPVVIGRAADPSLMRRLSLHRARAVAAVTADDLENISVAMTARGIHADIRTVLRVGDGNVANETRSLLALGIVRDVHRLAATLLAAQDPRPRRRERRVPRRRGPPVVPRRPAGARGARRAGVARTPGSARACAARCGCAGPHTQRPRSRIGSAFRDGPRSRRG